MNNLFRRFSTTFIMLGGMLLLTYCGDRGEDYMEDKDGEETAVGYGDEAAEGEEVAATEENPNAYPRDEVREPEEVNVEAEDNEYELPMDTEAAVSRIEKQKILALLMRQKTNMMNRIEELEALPTDASDNTVVRGDIDKLRTYIAKLDREIVDIRKANAGSMSAAAESALAAVKGAGALMQSNVIRIDRGF